MCMRRYSIRPTKPLGTASPDTPTPAPNPPDDDDGPAEPRSPVLPRRWVRPPSRHVSSPTTTTNNNVASFRFRSAFITPTYTSPILTRRSRPLGKHLPGTSASPGGLQRRLARSQRRRRMPLVSTAPVSARATPIEVPTFHVIHRPKDDEEEQQKQQQQQQSSPQPPPGSPRAASAEEPPEHPPRPHSIIAVPAQPLLLPHDTEGEVLVLPACDYDDIYQRHVSSNTSMVCMQFGRLPDGPPLPLLPQATSAHMCIPLPHVPSSNFFLPTTSVCRSSLSSRDRFSSWFADVKSPLGPIPSFSDASTTAMLLASSVTASFAASLASEPVPLTNNNNSNTRRRPSSGTPVPLPPSMPRPSISASSSSPPTSSAAAATGKSAAANAPEVNSMATMMMRNHNTNTNIAATINTSPPPPPHRVDPPTVPQDEEDDCVSHHHHHTVRATPTPPPARVESRGGDGLCPAVQQISLLSPLSTISPPRPGPATATRPSSTSLGPSLKQVQGAPFQLALFDDCSTEGSNNSSITSPIRVSPPRGELSMRRSLKVVHDGQLIVSFDADLSNTNNNNNKEELLPLNRREGSEGSTDPDVRPSSQQRQFFEWVKQRLVPQREVNARSSGSLDSAMMEMPIRLCHKKSASASDVGSFAT